MFDFKMPARVERGAIWLKNAADPVFDNKMEPRVGAGRRPAGGSSRPISIGSLPAPDRRLPNPGRANLKNSIIPAFKTFLISNSREKVAA